MRPLIISFSDNPHANKLKTAANQAQVGRGAGPESKNKNDGESSLGAEGAAPETPAKVTGRNGKEYPATKPKSKPGKPILFDEAGNVQVALAVFRLWFLAEHRKVDL